MPQAPQFNAINIPLGGLPGGSQDFKFFGRNVLRVSFLFIPADKQCVTLTNSGVFVQPMESGTRQLILNRIAHDIRFDPDSSPAQVNMGDEGFTVWTEVTCLAGTLFYWIDHTLTQISLGDAKMCCDDECGESGPCQDENVRSTFHDDFQSYFVDAGGNLHSDEHYDVTGALVLPTEQRNGWVQAQADVESATSGINTLQRTFGPVAAPGRRQETRGRIFVSVTVV
jgi:hypothetical protein